MKRPGPIIHLYAILSLILVACTTNSKPIISNLVIKPSPSFTAIPEFQKGVVYTSWWRGEYSSPESDTTITSVIKPLGVNWISIVVTCYQDNTKSINISCKTDTKTPTDDDLVHVIQYVHNQGLKVMLKPHIDLSNDAGHWRGEIGIGNDEDASKAWFASYSEFIDHYALLAQNNKVDYFVIGTELIGTSQHIDQWRAVISQIRRLYNGPITYAANWGEVFDVKWWNDLDAIGVDAYYPLSRTNHPTVAQLKNTWKPIVTRLGQLSQQWNRPIIVTEIGYRSISGTNSTAPTSTLTIDLQEQANYYQAMFEAFKSQAWWRGVFWWNWSTDPTQGGPADGNFTANNKPAENILRLNFGVSQRNLSTTVP